MPLTQVSPALLDSYASPTMFKNRIINGAMQVAQYGASYTLGTSGVWYTVDRFRCDAPAGSTISIAQSAVAPVGFSNSLLYQVTTGTTNANDGPEICYFIEGKDVADMAWGTADAQPFTFTFRARSSIAGTYGILFSDSSNTYAYATTYSLPVANTWYTITMTIPGPTSGGTWLRDNGRGLTIRWDMGTGTNVTNTANNAWTTVSASRYGVAGTVKLTQTTGAYFYLAGVQLEKGQQASSFEYRPIAFETILCQRYFEKSYNASVAPGTVTYDGNNFQASWGAAANRPLWDVGFAVLKRANPTMTFYSANGPSGKCTGPGGADYGCNLNQALHHNFQAYMAGTSSGSAGADYYHQWTAQAEL